MRSDGVFSASWADWMILRPLLAGCGAGLLGAEVELVEPSSEPFGATVSCRAVLGARVVPPALLRGEPAAEDPVEDPAEDVVEVTDPDPAEGAGKARVCGRGDDEPP